MSGGVVELSDVEKGFGGFVINGARVHSVSGAGDVNGDGLDDLIVGAPYNGPNGGYSGASFVLFGKVDGGVVELSEVQQGTGGFVINGVSYFDVSGWSVSGAGDVNGDGLDDLIIGAKYDDTNGADAGASFVVFGKGDGGVVELSEVKKGTGGFVINGVSAGDESGTVVSGAGDVNGDGLADLIVGVDRDGPNGAGSGASFVVFGKPDGGVVELSEVQSGTGGFVINGVSAGDQSGRSVSGAGDVNGDGLDDLIVGAPSDDTNGADAGASFVVFGKGDGGVVELSEVKKGTGGFVINGVLAGDYTGKSVSNAGDVNGDGLDDLIVGAPAPYDDPNGGRSGASFVVFGKADSGIVELSEVERGMGGFLINGVSADDYAGFSVSGAGDVNRDGLDDLIVGAWGADPSGDSSGSASVVFGKVDGGVVELSDLKTGTGGFVIDGVSVRGLFGYSVSGAGDVNRDDFDDLIVGAWGDSASFVVFGGNFAFTTQTGTVSADILTGADANDALLGAAGNDSIDGLAGTDSLLGGDGDDTIDAGDGNDTVGAGTGDDSVLGGEGDDSIVGYEGNDTLRGNAGADLLIGGAGNDDLNGGTGSDTVHGTGGNDTLAGWDDDDTLYGGDDNDSLLGGSGDDQLWGNAGMDALRGQDGADTLNGGYGDDTLTGGADADVFLFIRWAGNDVVEDFEDGLDRIDLTAFGTTYDEMKSAISDDGTGALINLDDIGGRGSIYLSGTAQGLIGAEDFIFDPGDAIL